MPDEYSERSTCVSEIFTFCSSAPCALNTLKSVSLGKTTVTTPCVGFGYRFIFLCSKSEVDMPKVDVPAAALKAQSFVFHW